MKVNWREGEFNDTPETQVWDTDDVSVGFEQRQQRRLLQFPCMRRHRALPLWPSWTGADPSQNFSELTTATSSLAKATSTDYSFSDLISAALTPLPKSTSRPCCTVQPEVKRATFHEEAPVAAPKRRKSLRGAGDGKWLTPGPLKEFADWATQQYSSLVAVWRKLDKDGSMSLHKKEFMLGLKDLRYPGDAGQLWGAFDRDQTGTVSFLEFAPENALDLARWKAWALAKFGSIRGLFHALDKDKNGKISFAEFTEACQREGLPDRLKESVDVLFTLVADARHKDVITGGKLDFLDVWRPPAYLWEAEDSIAAIQFKEAVARRYNHNPWLAWRRVLDKNNSMRVGFSEFIEACRELSKAGIREAAPRSVTALYVAFDKDRSGWFTLRDWDQLAYTHLQRFVAWSSKGFRKVSECLRSMEEVSGEGVSLSAFRRAVKPLEMESEEMESLFEGLSQKPIQIVNGRMKASRILSCHYHYLDGWRPEEEAQESEAWEKMASRKMSLKRGYSIDMGSRGRQSLIARGGRS
jgi:Ca2+-binding EF-hand superfamily protein